MADAATITRRFALKAFPFIGAAIAAPVGTLAAFGIATEAEADDHVTTADELLAADRIPLGSAPASHPAVRQAWAVDALKAAAKANDPTITRMAVADDTETGGLSYVAFYRGEIGADPYQRERAEVERLIGVWASAVARHEVIFVAQDNGDAVEEEEVSAALGPIDDALEALCRYRPHDPAARARRSDFLADELPRSTYGCEELMRCMYRALTA